MRNRLFHLLAAATAACLPTFADVIDVGGPNPDAATIDAAIQIALDGDVIRVWPGSYPTATIDGKSLSVVAALPGSDVHCEVISILNLPATGSVEIVGINKHAPPYGREGNNPTVRTELSIADCEGSVRISDSNFYYGYIPEGLGVNTVTVLHSQDVVFSDCGITGYTWHSWCPQCSGGNGLYTRNSNLALYRTWIAGGIGGYTFWDDCSGLFGDGGPGGCGLVVDEAGSISGPGSIFLSLCILEKGYGGGTECSAGSSGPDGESLLLLPTTTTEIRAQQTFADNQPISHPSVTVIPGRARRMTSPAWVSDTDTLEVIIHGKPGDRVGLFYGTEYDHRILPIGGPLLVDVGSGANLRPWQYLGQIDGSGRIVHPVPVRDLPTLTHVKLHMVAVALEGNDRFYTNSVSPLILDAAW